MKIKNVPHQLLSYYAPGFKFHIMHSSKGYSDKDSAKSVFRGNASWKISPNDTEMTIKQFADKISNGHIFCSSLCNTNHKNFENRAMEYTNMIFFDIDEMSISLFDFMYWLGNKHPDIEPTIYYESYSSTFDKPRIRLVYIFDEQIQIRRRLKLYTYIRDCIYDMFPYNEVVLDECYEKNPSQMAFSTSLSKIVNGSYRVFKTHFTDESQSATLDQLISILQDKESLQAYINGELTLESLLSLYYHSQSNKGVYISYDNAIFEVTSDDILDALDKIKAINYNSDFHINKRYAGSAVFKSLVDEVCCKNDALMPSEFLEKHKSEFEILTKTKVNWPEGITMMQTPSDYIDLNWLRLWNNKKIVKIKDGQRRRAHLSLIASALRLIKPEITPEEMFYNLMHERLMFVDNSTDVIRNHELRSMVVNAYNKDLETIRTELLLKVISNKPEFIIKEGSGRKSIGSKKGRVHKPYKLKWDPELIDWTKSPKVNWEQIRMVYNDVKESTIRKYMSLHKEEHLLSND